MSKEKMKNRGITLISLIITIIIMLIFTGVVLSIALGENGIVYYAKQAKIETQRAMEKEDEVIMFGLQKDILNDLEI